MTHRSEGKGDFERKKYRRSGTGKKKKIRGLENGNLKGQQGEGERVANYQEDRSNPNA